MKMKIMTMIILIKVIIDKGYYSEDYKAERRARLDMYEDASDITDESDYWDYIGGDY